MFEIDKYNWSDWRLIKSMDKAILDKAGVDLEAIERRMYAELEKTMKNKTGYVQKEVQVTRNGKTFTRKQWVRASESETKEANKHLGEMKQFAAQSKDLKSFAEKFRGNQEAINAFRQEAKRQGLTEKEMFEKFVEEGQQEKGEKEEKTQPDKKGKNESEKKETRQEEKPKKKKTAKKKKELSYTERIQELEGFLDDEDYDWESYDGGSYRIEGSDYSIQIDILEDEKGFFVETEHEGRKRKNKNDLDSYVANKKHVKTLRGLKSIMDKYI